MKRGRLTSGVLVPSALLFLLAPGLGLMASTVAHAFPDYVGSRALGMGGAGRADARGDQGPLLNPAGMSLGRLYTVEAGYQFITRDGGQLFRGAAVDSTSAFKVGGGLFYNYRTASPAGVPKLSGHEAGLALSYPISDALMIGASGKYVRVSGGAFDANNAPDKDSGITGDAGLAVRLGSKLTLGVAGYNLHDLKTPHAPLAMGYGIAFAPGTSLLLVVDGLHDFTTYDPTRGVRTTVGGGAEYTFERKVIARLGGGRDGVSEHGYVTAGAAVMSELGAIDFGFRQDVSGDRKLTYLAVGLRLFVPSPP